MPSVGPEAVPDLTSTTGGTGDVAAPPTVTATTAAARGSTRVVHPATTTAGERDTESGGRTSTRSVRVAVAGTGGATTSIDKVHPRSVNKRCRD